MANTAKFLQVVADGNVLSFKLGNGLKVVCDTDDLSDDIRQAALLHGVNQKIRDSAAGFSKDGDYTGAYRAMQTTLDNLESGLWNARGGASGEGDLAQAVANLKGIELEVAAEAVRGLDEEGLKTLRNKPKVKAEILRLKAERAANVAEASDDEDILDI